MHRDQIMDFGKMSFPWTLHNQWSTLFLCTILIQHSRQRVLFPELQVISPSEKRLTNRVGLHWNTSVVTMEPLFGCGLKGPPCIVCGCSHNAGLRANTRLHWLDWSVCFKPWDIRTRPQSQTSWSMICCHKRAWRESYHNQFGWSLDWFNGDEHQQMRRDALVVRTTPSKSDSNWFVFLFKRV